MKASKETSTGGRGRATLKSVPLKRNNDRCGKRLPDKATTHPCPKARNSMEIDMSLSAMLRWEKVAPRRAGIRTATTRCNPDGSGGATVKQAGETASQGNGRIPRNKQISTRLVAGNSPILRQIAG
jgi:hypothetical protein